MIKTGVFKYFRSIHISSNQHCRLTVNLPRAWFVLHTDSNSSPFDLWQVHPWVVDFILSPLQRSGLWHRHEGSGRCYYDLRADTNVWLIQKSAAVCSSYSGLYEQPEVMTRNKGCVHTGFQSPNEILVQFTFVSSVLSFKADSNVIARFTLALSTLFF